VSNKHRYARKNILALTELSKENFILFDKVAILHDVILDACRRAGFIPTISYSTIRIESILSLVASNMGIALMPEKLFEYYNTPENIAIQLEEVIQSDIALVYLRHRKLPRAAKIFVTSLERMLSADII
jgi:LysR family transcriptional activator of glutamate synthase operon